MFVKIQVNPTGIPVGKVAEAELHFEDHDGPLAGLKLVGFGIWQRRGKTERQVTFPARHYSLSGQQRTYALLRPITGSEAQAQTRDKVRELILQAFENCDAKAA